MADFAPLALYAPNLHTGGQSVPAHQLRELKKLVPHFLRREDKTASASRNSSLTQFDESSTSSKGKWHSHQHDKQQGPRQQKQQAHAGLERNFD